METKTTPKSKVIIIDLETSIKNRGEYAVGKMQASPFLPMNRIVWLGSKVFGKESKAYRLGTHWAGDFASYVDANVLVGQNIKFDLLYLMRNSNFRDRLLPKMQVWDTMLAEYLLTGQKERMISLDKLVDKYGVGTLKDERLKELWATGVDTEDIDSSIIEPYLVEDLKNTELIFMEQLKQANALGMLKLIRSQMDALLATTEMEYNGMYFNKESALEERVVLAHRRNTLETELCAQMKSVLPDNIMAEVTPSSSTQVSQALFGGLVKTKTAIPILGEDGLGVMYKSGKRMGEIKTKIQIEPKRIEGMHVPLHVTEEGKIPFTYKVNDDVLTSILGLIPPWDARYQFCVKLVQFRALTKDISTYYDGYSKLVWAHDSCIHPNYNHCATATGRLSHSAPNLGNVSHNK